ncbi:nectin-4-like [Strigops habroptila]|uniref:nectin-4-like n=1 Tax=Strigops habroptila TaxID=2489341 RepID=UPI0011D015AA|nr:nectin-4-like [Strigops habroptila]
MLSVARASPPGSVQVMHRKVQSVRAGGNVTFSCQSVAKEDVLQVTWQKETDGVEDNIATYSVMNGQKIAKGYVGHVSFAHTELQASAISLHGVTLQDEGCYKCIFNTFPLGALTGRMCLKVYAISDPKVEAKLIPSPDKAEDSEKVVGMSCSATGKPAPKITWHLPSVLQQKPREYHVLLGNQTVTVISNFTHTYSRILQEYPIACEIQHPSLNVTLVLPTDSLVQGPDSPDSSVAPAIVIAVGVLVPLTSLLLLGCLLHRCLRHLRDPERNPAWPCWTQEGEMRSSSWCGFVESIKADSTGCFLSASRKEFAVLVDFKNPGDKKKTGWGTPLQPGPAATQG